jgi:uncharacterized protein YbbK (DUF523 family)
MSINATLWTHLHEASIEKPLHILTSACLVGHRVGWDDRAYTSSEVQKLTRHPKVKAVHFCPENIIMGTPRLLTTVHGGNGFDVLDGKATVQDTESNDFTTQFIYSAHQLLSFVEANNVVLAVMMEISDSCGSTAIYLGNPADKTYQKGPGVSTALLMRNGISVIGSRDYKTLGKIMNILNEEESSLTNMIDFKDDPWYQEYFKDISS